MKSFLKLFLFLDCIFKSYSFFEPHYKGVGSWSLRGTSNNKHQHVDINLYIMPTQNRNNLSINWVKQNTFGPLVIRDIIEGEINFDDCKEAANNSDYNFIAEKYSISLITILGILIPSIINIEQPINERCNKEITWTLEENLLLLKISDHDYIFSRDVSQIDNLNLIRLENFLTTQLLGYIAFKLIDKMHLM